MTRSPSLSPSRSSVCSQGSQGSTTSGSTKQRQPYLPKFLDFGGLSPTKNSSSALSSVASAASSAAAVAAMKNSSSSKRPSNSKKSKNRGSFGSGSGSDQSSNSKPLSRKSRSLSPKPPSESGKTGNRRSLSPKAGRPTLKMFTPSSIRNLVVGGNSNGNGNGGSDKLRTPAARTASGGSSSNFKRRSIRPLATSVNSSITMNSSLSMLDLDDFGIGDFEGMANSNSDLAAAAKPPVLARGESLDSDCKPLRPLRRYSNSDHNRDNNNATPAAASPHYHPYHHHHHHPYGNRRNSSGLSLSSRHQQLLSSSVTSNGTMHSSITMTDFDDILEGIPLPQTHMERGISMDSDSKPLRPYRRRSSATSSSSSLRYNHPQQQSRNNGVFSSFNSMASSITMTDWDGSSTNDFMLTEGSSSALQSISSAAASRLMMTKPILERGESLDSDSKPLRPYRRDSDSVCGGDNNSVASSTDAYNFCGRKHHLRQAMTGMQTLQQQFDHEHPQACHNHGDEVVPIIPLMRRLDTIVSLDSQPQIPGRQGSMDMAATTTTTNTTAVCDSVIMEVTEREDESLVSDSRNSGRSQSAPAAAPPPPCDNSTANDEATTTTTSARDNESQQGSMTEEWLANLEATKKAKRKGSAASAPQLAVGGGGDDWMTSWTGSTANNNGSSWMSDWMTTGSAHSAPPTTTAVASWVVQRASSAPVTNSNRNVIATSTSSTSGRSLGTSSDKQDEVRRTSLHLNELKRASLDSQPIVPGRHESMAFLDYSGGSNTVDKSIRLIQEEAHVEEEDDIPRRESLDSEPVVPGRHASVAFMDYSGGNKNTVDKSIHLSQHDAESRKQSSDSQPIVPGRHESVAFLDYSGNTGSIHLADEAERRRESLDSQPAMPGRHDSIVIHSSHHATVDKRGSVDSQPLVPGRHESMAFLDYSGSSHKQVQEETRRDSLDSQPSIPGRHDSIVMLQRHNSGSHHHDASIHITSDKRVSLDSQPAVPGRHDSILLTDHSNNNTSHHDTSIHMTEKRESLDSKPVVPGRHDSVAIFDYSGNHNSIAVEKIMEVEEARRESIDSQPSRPGRHESIMITDAHLESQPSVPSSQGSHEALNDNKRVDAGSLHMGKPADDEDESIRDSQSTKSGHEKSLPILVDDVVLGNRNDSSVRSFAEDSTKGSLHSRSRVEVLEDAASDLSHKESDTKDVDDDVRSAPTTTTTRPSEPSTSFDVRSSQRSGLETSLGGSLTDPVLSDDVEPQEEPSPIKSLDDNDSCRGATRIVDATLMNVASLELRCE